MKNNRRSYTHMLSIGQALHSAVQVKRTSDLMDRWERFLKTNHIPTPVLPEVLAAVEQLIAEYPEDFAQLKRMRCDREVHGLLQIIEEGLVPFLDGVHRTIRDVFGGYADFVARTPLQVSDGAEPLQDVFRTPRGYRIPIDTMVRDEPSEGYSRGRVISYNYGIVEFAIEFGECYISEMVHGAGSVSGTKVRAVYCGRGVGGALAKAIEDNDLALFQALIVDALMNNGKSLLQWRQAHYASRWDATERRMVSEPRRTISDAIVSPLPPQLVAGTVARAAAYILGQADVLGKPPAQVPGVNYVHIGDDGSAIVEFHEKAASKGQRFVKVDSVKEPIEVVFLKDHEARDLLYGTEVITTTQPVQEMQKVDAAAAEMELLAQINENKALAGLAQQAIAEEATAEARQLQEVESAVASAKVVIDQTLDRVTKVLHEEELKMAEIATANAVVDVEAGKAAMKELALQDMANAQAVVEAAGEVVKHTEPSSDVPLAPPQAADRAEAVASDN